jgi:hypothetical protein
MFSGLFSENRVICDIMWKNMIKPCWITKVTNTLIKCDTYCFSMAKKWLRERALMLRYMYTASLVTDRAHSKTLLNSLYTKHI